MTRLISFVSFATMGSAMSVASAHPGHDDAFIASLSASHLFAVLGGAFDVVAFVATGTVLCLAASLLSRTRVVRPPVVASP